MQMQSNRRNSDINRYRKFHSDAVCCQCKWGPFKKTYEN